MRKIWASLDFLFSMRNIWARFAQDCTSFSNAQYMRKIVLISQCARLYLFLQCTIQGVPKNLLESGEQCIVGSPFNFVFSGCLTRRKINAPRIV